MSRFVITATWDDNAPHLTHEAREDLYKNIPAYQRDARTRGIPQLGAGVIFPIPEEDILVDAFKIPPHWPRGYGLDVGWNRTAALWRCVDIDSTPRKSYFYDEHYSSEQSPTMHAAALLRRGAWIPGRIDPAARGRTQDDGKKLLDTWRKALYPEDVSEGILKLGIAVNAVESGLYAMLIAFQNGTLKVMRNRCPNWMAERRLYRRDEKGRIIKKNDHAMDAGRYNFFTGDDWLLADPNPSGVTIIDPVMEFGGASSGGNEGNLDWMGKV